MSYDNYIKEIGRGAEGARHLMFDEARTLYGDMLDGRVPDLEMGAIVLALRVKGESLAEMRGFLSAANQRLSALQRPLDRPRPVILPSYNGSRREANLTPLLALLLQRLGIPVVVHGSPEGFGRVTSGQIFREMGILPSNNLVHAQMALQEHNLAFVSLPTLSPGLSVQLALRERMGVRNSSHSLVKMLDPFKGEGVMVAAATHPAFIDLMRQVMLTEQPRALLLRGTEGEPFANPKRCPRIEYIHAGELDLLFDTEHESLKSLPQLPAESDPVTTAAWIQKVLDQHIPLPIPIANQLACCLFASGYTEDFTQAKAVVFAEGNFFEPGSV